MYLCIWSFTYPSIHPLIVRLSTYPPIHLSVYPFLICQSIHPSLCPSIQLLPVNLSAHPSFHLYIYLSFYLFIHPPTQIPTHLPIQHTYELAAGIRPSVKPGVAEWGDAQILITCILPPSNSAWRVRHAHQQLREGQK